MNRAFSVALVGNKIIAPCALILGFLAGTATDAFAQQYPFLPVEGSPKGVKVLFQDSRGRLWLGGQQPAWFDGTRFFFLRDYGFPAAEAADFSEDASGAIWIGAETGVYRFANGKVEQVAKGAAVSIIAHNADLAVAAIGPQGESRPTNTDLVRIRQVGGKWAAETVMTLDSPGPITLDSTGMLLYPQYGKGWNEVRLEDVARWQPGVQIQTTHHPENNFVRNGRVKVMRDRLGCLSVGADGGNIQNCGKGFQDAPFTGANVRFNLHEGPDGNMVLWGDSLLAVGRPGSFRIATRANGLPGLVDAIPGTDGTIWLATPQGLCRLPSPFHIESWTIRDGISDPPWSITRSRGRVYAGLDGGRVVALSEDRSRWDRIANFGSDLVSGLAGTDDGELYVTLRGAGTALLNSDGSVLARTEKGAAMRIARTPGGEVWVGNSYLARLTRSGSHLVPEYHPLHTQPARNVLAIKYEEHTHRLWSCYNGGLVVRDEHGVWSEFTGKDGLPGNGCWSLAPLPAPSNRTDREWKHR
jgi:hypothetical protein